DRAAMAASSQDAAALAAAAADSINTNLLSRSLLTGARSTTDLVRQRGSSLAPVGTLLTSDVEEDDSGLTDNSRDTEFTLPDYLIGPAAAPRRSPQRGPKKTSFLQERAPGADEAVSPQAVADAVQNLGAVWATVPG